MEGTTCPHCGMPVEEGASRCATCGAPLMATSAAGPGIDGAGQPPVDAMPAAPVPPGENPHIASPVQSVADAADGAAVAGMERENVPQGSTGPVESGASTAEPAPETLASDPAAATGAGNPTGTSAPAPAATPPVQRVQLSSPAVATSPYPPYPAYPPQATYSGHAPQPQTPQAGYPAPTYIVPGTATPYVAPGYRRSGWSYATGAAPAAVAPAAVAPGYAAPHLAAQGGQRPAVAPPASAPPPAGMPGYPAYPQGYGAYPAGAPAGPAYPYGYGTYGTGVPWGYYPAYVPVPVRKRHPSDTYALVVSWIVTSAGGLSVLCGLLVSLILFISLANGGTSGSISTETSFFAFITAPLVGGALALYYGIRGILRRPSPRFALPHPALFGGLTVAVFVAAIVLWHVNAASGPALMSLPLVVLSSALPALTILAFTAWRLRMPTSRRHVWMSLIYGSTLAALIALILNTIGEVVVVLFLISVQRNSGSAQDPLSTPQLTPEIIVAAFLIVAVMAPLVEEGVKPLGAALIMRRLATPASAFLTGLASGVGFSVFESVSIYIGRGEADWVIIALERVGAGLLHGVGAGMGALGWYYFINGKGVRRRWLRGFGCLGYAVLQHAFFNGSALVLAILPGDVGHWLAQPFYLGRLPLDRASLLFFLYYVGIAVVLVTVTGRLRRSTTKRELTPLSPAPMRAPVPEAVATTNLQPMGSAAQ